MGSVHIMALPKFQHAHMHTYMHTCIHTRIHTHTHHGAPVVPAAVEVLAQLGGRQRLEHAGVTEEGFVTIPQMIGA